MLNIGNTWYMLGNMLDAVAAYDVAIELDPEYAKAIEYRDTVAAMLPEESDPGSAASMENRDQSDTEDGRPARDDDSTPSERPIP